MMKIILIPCFLQNFFHVYVSHGIFKMKSKIFVTYQVNLWDSDNKGFLSTPRLHSTFYARPIGYNTYKKCSLLERVFR